MPIEFVLLASATIGGSGIVRHSRQAETSRSTVLIESPTPYPPSAWTLNPGVAFATAIEGSCIAVISEGFSQRRGKRMRLQAELDQRIAELRAMKDGWDGPKSKRPLAAALETVPELGREILRQPNSRLPHDLNISAARNGAICFTLFGTGKREAELWLEETPGVIHVLTTDGADEAESTLLGPEEYLRVAAWLHGNASHI